jgi:hypothetical protein
VGAGYATIGLARKFIDPRVLPSVDQAEGCDQSAANLTGGWFDRMVEQNIRIRRDARLVRVLSGLTAVVTLINMN